MRKKNPINNKEQELQRYWNIFQWEFLRRSEVYRKDYEIYVEIRKELEEKDPASYELFRFLIFNSIEPLVKKISEISHKKEEEQYKPSTPETLALFQKYQQHREKIVEKYGYHRYIPLLPPDLNLLDENYNYISDYRAPDFAGFIENGVDFLYKWELENYGKLGLVFDQNDLGYRLRVKKSLPERKPCILLLEVDLRRPVKDLGKAFNKLITEKKDIIRNLYKSAENNPHWEEYKSYLKVFDLKTSPEGFSLYEIGCRVFPLEAISDTELASKKQGERKMLKEPFEKKVDRYYRKAKQLIANAARHDFPGPTS
jgi:hypothetical protein